MVEALSPEAKPTAEQRFAALLAAHAGIVRKIAATYSRDRDERADLAQDIAATLWRGLSALRHDAFLRWAGSGAHPRLARAVDDMLAGWSLRRARAELDGLRAFAGD